MLFLFGLFTAISAWVILTILGIERTCRVEQLRNSIRAEAVRARESVR